MNNRGVQPFAVAVIAVLVMAAVLGTIMYVWRPDAGGCTRTLVVSVTDVATGKPAYNVPVMVTAEWKMDAAVASGRTDMDGRVTFLSVPCGVLGLHFGGGEWTLSNPVSLDTSRYSGFTIVYDTAVSKCPSGQCALP